MQVVNCLQLYVKEVADFPVRVRGVADAIELEINVAQSSFGGLTAKFFTLGKFDAVARSLH